MLAYFSLKKTLVNIWTHSQTMIRESRQLVTDEPVEVEDCRKSIDQFRGIYRIHPILTKEIGGCEHVTNRLDLQTLGSQPIMMPKNLPDHWSQTPNVSANSHIMSYLHFLLKTKRLFCSRFVGFLGVYGHLSDDSEHPKDWVSIEHNLTIIIIIIIVVAAPHLQQAGRQPPFGWLVGCVQCMMWLLWVSFPFRSVLFLPKSVGTFVGG